MAVSLVFVLFRSGRWFRLRGDRLRHQGDEKLSGRRLNCGQPWGGGAGEHRCRYFQASNGEQTRRSTHVRQSLMFRAPRLLLLVSSAGGRQLVRSGDCKSQFSLFVFVLFRRSWVAARFTVIYLADDCGRGGGLNCWRRQSLRKGRVKEWS